MDTESNHRDDNSGTTEGVCDETEALSSLVPHLEQTEGPIIP
jgi:hypothetical protein